MNLNKTKRNDHPWKSRSGVRLLLCMLLIMAVVFSSTACSITVAGIGLEITSVDKNGNVTATVTLSDINRTNFLQIEGNELSRIAIYYAFTEAKAAALADYAGIAPEARRTIRVPQTAYDGFSSVDISAEENNAFKTDPTEPTSFSKQLSFQLPAEAKEKNIAFLVVLDGIDGNDSVSVIGANVSSVIFNYTWEDSGYTVTYVANNGTNEKVVEDNRAAGDYIIQAYDKNFTVPDGKVFDYWEGSDDGKYKDEQTIQLTGDLTLTAQWKEEKKPDGGEKKTSGGGSGFDIVFNIPGEDNSWEYAPGYAPQQAYRVSLAPMQGGSAALGLTTGDSGTQMNVYPSTTVYVFPNAEQGYVLDKIVWSLIDGSASYDITEAKNFVMPAMDVVVYVTFRPVG